MPIDWFPLWLSLRVAGFATMLSLIISLWLAYILANRECRGKKVLDAAITLPLVLPPTVLGYYLLVLLGRERRSGAFMNPSLDTPRFYMGCRTWRRCSIPSRC